MRSRWRRFQGTKLDAIAERDRLQAGAHVKIAKRVTIHGLRRTATDLLRRAAVDPVAAKAIIGHTTDRKREHYATVGADEARGIGERIVSLVPAVHRTRGG